MKMHFEPRLAQRTPLARRALLGAAFASSAAATGFATPDATEPPPSLRDAAARADLLFGSDSDVDIRAAPEAYGELFVRHCNLLAPQLSWAIVAPQRYGSDPVREDPNIAFARTHGLRLTGGHLLWHENLPAWFDQLQSKADAIEAMRRHILSMTGQYGGMTYTWNVVNEAIEPKDGRSDGLRRTPLLELLGPDYIELAFRTARDAAPQAVLIYNDYGFEPNFPGYRRRRAALLRLLDRWRAAKVPIDAVGLQSHLILDGSRFDAVSYRSFLRDIADRGFALVISELDVLDLAPATDIAAIDADVAARYSEFLATALDEPAVVALVTWGLSDRYTWLTQQRDRHFARRDGLPNRPLPFDASYRPKPAFYAVLSALQHAPPRRPL
jgi:endo-1,4-beta-xylanase